MQVLQARFIDTAPSYAGHLVIALCYFFGTTSCDVDGGEYFSGHLEPCLLPCLVYWLYH